MFKKGRIIIVVIPIVKTNDKSRGFDINNINHSDPALKASRIKIPNTGHEKGIHTYS